MATNHSISTWNLSNPLPIYYLGHCDTQIINFNSGDDIFSDIWELRKYNILQRRWDSIPLPVNIQQSSKLFSLPKKIIISQNQKIIYLCFDISSLQHNKISIFAWEMYKSEPKYQSNILDGDFGDMIFLCGMQQQFFAFNMSNGECRMYIFKTGAVLRFRIDLSTMYPLTDYISHRRNHCIMHYIPNNQFICIFIVNNTRKGIYVQTIHMHGIYLS